MNKMYLVCNAHLDPVWLWEWEEGAAEAISTFRVAADLCEEFDGFIFNHNEVTLYKWVEEYEPELFARIQRLVKAGKWHIIGGWYLQPDVNLPSAESIVRQMLTGRKYFKDNFGVIPTTAVNFDPFGHPRGLVQLIKKGGYDSYLFCRPGTNECALPGDDFVWTGYDGSEIMAHRQLAYNTARTRAAEHAANRLKSNPDKKDLLFLWGVGNHGGGPSKIDLERIRDLIKKTKNSKILHSYPEQYFAQIKKSFKTLPRHDKDMNPFAVGCYTSMARIKQKHRKLENELYMLEKMMSHAALAGLLTYPQAEINESVNDLMQAEFHDILPGSSIQPVEETSIRLMDHALENISRLKARAFFALAGGQKVAAEGEIPILAYNPHPFAVDGIFECEFQLSDQNWKEEFTLPTIYMNGKRLPSQPEKELSNLNLDWRKRLIFKAKLEPGQVSRFDCRLEILPTKPVPQLKAVSDRIVFDNGELHVEISAVTGFVDSYKVSGVEYLSAPAFRAAVINDTDDAWGMTVMNFRNIAGEFALLSKEEGTAYSGIKGELLDSVRVVEEGEVRTVVEAVFKYNNSYIYQTYKLPKKGTEIRVDTRVFWNEKTKMLKMLVPLNLKDPAYIGQVCGGVEDFTSVIERQELVAQKWNAVVSDTEDRAFTCLNNGSYGLDYVDGEMRLSLLRSPAYTGHPIKQRPIVPAGRYTNRMDQGERTFTFWFDAGKKDKMMKFVSHSAIAKNEEPFVLSFFPSGHGKASAPSVRLSSPVIQMMAFKKSEFSENFILRLSNPTGKVLRTKVEIPAAGISDAVSLKKFEIKTFEVIAGETTLKETTLLEGIV